MKEQIVQTTELLEPMVYLVDLSKGNQIKIEAFVKEHGIRSFFLNLETFDLSYEAKRKLLALHNVIDAFDFFDAAKEGRDWTEDGDM